MDVFLHDVAQESRGHSKEEDGKAERPLRGSLGKADIVSDFLAEDRPTVDRTDAAMEEQRRDRGAQPFVLIVFHDVPRFLLCIYPTSMNVMCSSHYCTRNSAKMQAFCGVPVQGLVREKYCVFGDFMA